MCTELLKVKFNLPSLPGIIRYLIECVDLVIYIFNIVKARERHGQSLAKPFQIA